MYNITELFLECMYERNVDRTINLILHGHKLERNNRNRVSSAEVELICNHLKKKSNVVALQLCYNSIGDEGATKLAEFLKDCRSIKYLDLRMNEIGADGVKSFLNVGEYLTIKSLNLAGNKIGKQGGIYISELIRVNESLQHIDLAETDQTSTSIAYLLAAIAENSTLKNFNLSRVIAHPGHTFDVDHLIDILSRVLSILQTLIEAKIINSETCDLMVYQAPGDTNLSLAHNQTVDIFREEYYSVSKETDNFKQQSIREKNARKLMHFVLSWPMPPTIMPEFGTPFLD